MKKLIIAVMCLFFISACKPEKNDFIKNGENIVREKLNNPDDAKFNAGYFKYGDNAAYVCGDVTYKKIMMAQVIVINFTSMSRLLMGN